MDLVAVPQLDSVVLRAELSLNLKDSALFSAGVFFAGVVGDTLGGVVSDVILRRTVMSDWRAAASSRPASSAGSSSSYRSSSSMT